MVSRLSLPCLSVLLFAVGPALAEDAPTSTSVGGDPAPTLKAEELRKLYGEQKKLIQTVSAKGHNLTMDVYPDGRLYGHDTSLIGTAAVAGGNSDGKWRVDETENKVCHEWGNKFWTGGCRFVRPVGQDAYEWFGSAGRAGSRFTITPQ
jgi:hypothetical protein